MEKRCRESSNVKLARVSRPLVYEPPGGAVSEVIFPHALLDGIDRVLPPISGFVLTQTKDSPLAQVLIQSPKPDTPENATVLAVWTYGLGRTAVLTTDAGARWASSWADWADYDKFFSQLVRWLMRPTGDTGKFTISTQVRDGRGSSRRECVGQGRRVFEFLGDERIGARPGLETGAAEHASNGTRTIRRFVPSRGAGSYFVNVVPGAGAAPLRTGVTVPYSDEFRVRETNLALIELLASIEPRGGEPGQVTAPLDDQPSEELIDTNAFRGGLALARSIKDAWPWFVLTGCCIFLADIFVRRVSINLDWVGKAINKIRGEQTEKDAQVTARLDALKKNKEALGDSLERRRCERAI